MKKTLNTYLYLVKRGSALLIFGLLVFLFSCSDDEAGDPSTGFSKEIKNFVPDSTIAKLREMGMEINEGTQPPVIEGIYFASPVILLATSVPEDQSDDIGKRFFDYVYRFKEQDDDALTISLDTKGLNQSGEITSLSEGNGAYLSGFDSVFTAFIVLETERFTDEGTVRSKTLQVISGKIGEHGIEDFQLSLTMLDNYGNPFGTLIPNNTGRLFHDGDYLAAKISSFRTASVEGIETVGGIESIIKQ